MDSWHAGTGATDNGAGVAVGMEGAIIRPWTVPRRTIWIALWTGEEQGLLVSGVCGQAFWQDGNTTDHHY
jgi:Zn-dependent M28 family amino/carboxypeptidase